jgi:cell wall-associated NlpC family hydrolase
MVAIEWAKGQLGTPYKLGAKPRLGQMRIGAADCSGFARAAVAITGIRAIQHPTSPTGPELPIHKWHGTWAQAEWLLPVPVKYALAHVGHFVMRRPSGDRYGHIALTLGGGRTIEARGRAHGVCVVDAEHNDDRRRSGFWNHAGKIRRLFEPWDGDAEAFVAFIRELTKDR